jgi:hypothetical protein
MPRSAQSSAIRFTSSGGSTEPQGLCGELTMTIFVFGVISRLSSSTSVRNRFASRSGSGTALAPENSIIDS